MIDCSATHYFLYLLHLKMDLLSTGPAQLEMAKVKPKWKRDLTTKAKTIKLIEENTQEKPSDIGTGNFKKHITKQTQERLNWMTSRSVMPACQRSNQQRWVEKPIEWENVCSYIPDKDPIPGTYEECRRSSNNKGKHINSNRHFPEDQTWPISSRKDAWHCRWLEERNSSQSAVPSHSC